VLKVFVFERKKLKLKRAYNSSTKNKVVKVMKTSIGKRRLPL
jgi:hypothetical protein